MRTTSEKKPLTAIAQVISPIPHTKTANPTHWAANGTGADHPKRLSKPATTKITVEPSR
jgi:hypothetical protein